MNQSGVTLIETLVVMLVIAALLSIAMPGLASIASNGQLTSATNDLVSSLHLARSEAIKRNGRAVVCKSADGLACAANGDWQQGWLVFHDDNNNASVDASETIVMVHPGLPAGYQITGNRWVARYISYTPSGSATTTTGVLQIGTVTLCHTSGTQARARQIVISVTGRPRTVKLPGSSCS